MRGLLAMGAEPAKAAVHAQLGHLLGDQTAIDVLEMAGRTGLAAGALEGAVNYLATAVELAGDLVSPTLLLELAEAELATGRTERVREACLRALELAPDAAGRVDAQVMLARFAFNEEDEEGLRWTEAVHAAEGSDKLLGVLAEAVMVLSKVLGPSAVASWAARLRVLRPSPALAADRSGPCLGDSGGYGWPGRRDRSDTGRVGRRQPGVGDGIGLTNAVPLDGGRGF